MLINGTCKNPDGDPMIVDDSEIIEIYETILKQNKASSTSTDRNDIIVMWCLTALPKLSIRIGSANPVNPENSQSAIITRIKKNLEEFSSNSNIEIQQRACEFLAILSEGWKDLRV